MDEKGSRPVAAKKQPTREKTRFPGVYSRKLINRNTGKADTAFDITYRNTEGKKVWVLIGYASDGVNAAYANAQRGNTLAGIPAEIASMSALPSRKGSTLGMPAGIHMALR